jgi:hypothetical protein
VKTLAEGGRVSWDTARLGAPRVGG